MIPDTWFVSRRILAFDITESGLMTSRHVAGPRLLIRGGSIAAEQGVGHGYVDRIRDVCDRRGFDLVNRSRPRDTSFDGIWTFDEDIAPYRPRILMIHFGLDDAFLPVYRSEFKENLVRMVRQARELFDPVILMPTSHTFENPYEMDAVYIYYRTIREVCQDLDCEMIAVHTWWAGYLQERALRSRDLTQEDARLPNERGHAVFAEAVMPALKRAFERVARAG
ncbi:MAG TPA: SGNH/GDSL hydrolase family protein [Deltaproteobacteria bacterium]|jgi:lysophospholipase L1-like esterase|nr:SGNH/GDSL hydrolase family protein [Deltaproteobacteria bacterium]HRW80738.1 SGNH/GDSL hydrolase family protein [Desulfomonilia bacterium]HNQ86104.1 SGNH/GDSL hydrolase family protein [Deltaproteobacteria bacterium]HOA44516.1 SGNH/GDSL hydrolase family protein [Deltaproteobacteria bacterium]HOC76876.1 SGNH/GDSL hydrolase family protein [Deltaproteobacteria bacterium]